MESEMEPFNVFRYGDYDNLWLHEANAIAEFMDHDNREPLAQLIESDAVKSSSIKRFIADVTAGRLKRSKGKKLSTFNRDWSIYNRVKELLYEGHALYPNRKGNSAVDITANEYPPISTDTVLKIYKEFKKAMGSVSV